MISLQNLFLAWAEFKRGKSKKKDVLQFEFNLEDNLFQLHQELRNKTWQHSKYTLFQISDPKLRQISKACVKDRVLHQAIFRILYPIFDKSFIFDSYSCRLNKGIHRAVKRLNKFCCTLSKNYTHNVFILKCDIKKFFDSVNHEILLKLIQDKIADKNAITLIKQIIQSFSKQKDRGLPLGNVTSQLFANIYLNELDQFTKHQLKIKYYLRYCDDFVILDNRKDYLIKLIPVINNFLQDELKLKLHSQKIILRKYFQGVDFLGYVILPYQRVLRTKTKRRMLKKIKSNQKKFKAGLMSREFFDQSLQSYYGVLKHCDGYKIIKKLVDLEIL